MKNKKEISVKIERATKGGILEIDDIYTSCSIEEVRLQFPNKKLKEIKKDYKDYKKSRLIELQKNIRSSKHHIIVLKFKNKTVGIGEAFMKSKTVGHLDKVYISKKYRRLGFASGIEKELELWIKQKGGKIIESGVYSKNIPSIDLHKKMDFEVVAIRFRKELK